MTVAWDLIGFPQHEGHRNARVRIKGGRALYEQVDYSDVTGGRLVRLSRLDVDEHGLKPVVRYVDPDTELEVIPDEVS